jgi:hypothetical protein
VPHLLTPYVGGYFPGPLPFQPTGLTALDGYHETIYGCAEIDGWAQGKATHEPLHARRVAGAQFVMQRANGPWLVDSFELNGKVPCSGVKVQAPTW